MPRLSRLILALLLCLALSGCSPRNETVIEPLPQIAWDEIPITPFSPQETLQRSSREWNIVNDALHFSVKLPEALETRLIKKDRELWKGVLENMERSQLERKDASLLAGIQIQTPVVCTPVGSAMSLQQRAQLQLNLQLHRNVLWRLGRLEMASRGVTNSIRNFIPMFTGGRMRDADNAVVSPVSQMAAQIESQRKDQPVPKGNWMPGEFHPRMARTAHAAPVYLGAKLAFADWSLLISQSPRWNYLADSSKPVIETLDTWTTEYDKLIQAFRALASNIQSLERDFSPPHALLAYPCLNQNLRIMHILSDLYTHVLTMQWDLTQARISANQLKIRLHSPDYSSTNHEFLESIVDDFLSQVDAQQAKLSRAEDLILYVWDEATIMHWSGLPDFIDPIHHHSHAAVENAQTWNLLFREIQTDLAETRKKLEPEPPQPLTRRGKTQQPYIATILETLHAPSRIDEAERGLLAISEIEAHLVSVRDELLRLCKQGACRSFPEAELSNSPRQSTWIVSWRQAPSAERTLGHTLIVIKLCQLHLSRLVQRLTEIYAWFAETSNADLSWKKLKSWQRVWTLYAETNGTYANYLRSIALLDSTITNMTVLPKNRAGSDTLLRLLSIQDRFFDLTLDYARMIDGKQPAPTSFDALISTWEELDSQLTAIETATLQRDAQENPDSVKPTKQWADIPR